MISILVKHTTASLALNELDESCLVADAAQFLETLIPRRGRYLHNSSHRSENLDLGCSSNSDKKCDENGDAHLKAMIFGSPTFNLPIYEGKISLGVWQKIFLLDFDGPRRRTIDVMLLG